MPTGGAQAAPTNSSGAPASAAVCGSALEALPAFVDRGGQLALLGSGDPDLERVVDREPVPP